MDEKGKGKITRREFMKKLGYSAAAVGVASTAPRLLKPARAAKRDYILLGHPNPATGGIASFGEGSPWANNLVIDAINKKGGIYIEEYGKQVPVKVRILDTESNPSKAGEVASRLILHDKIDLMVAMHTPDVCNPVSAICERYEMPCVNTDCPFEACGETEREILQIMAEHGKNVHGIKAEWNY